MADLANLNYDPSKVEDVGEGNFRCVPPGIYNVVIVDSSIHETKAGNGKYLEITYQIIEGREVGQTVKDRINVVNPSETAQRIGLSQLKKICEAVGHKGQLKDSCQLHGKPMSIKVTIEEFESNKEPGKMLQSNRVENRMPKQAVAAAPPPRAATPAEAAQQAGAQAGLMPW